MTRRPAALTAVALAAGLAAAACSSAACSFSEAGADSSPATTTAPPIADKAPPPVSVEVVADGLDHPWDVAKAPDGTIVFTERAGSFTAVRPGAEPTPMSADLSDLVASSETGLMALALSPDFEQDRTAYTCQGIESGGGRSVGVVAWTVAPDWSGLTRERTVIDGFPVSTGRHGGCRILPADDGTLLIGTGDAAQPSVPQDRNSLGGKVLRVDAATGAPAADNPDPASPVFTLGHRNVQGLAEQPGTGRLYSVEQGSSRDDEVNVLTPGGNYGWSPDRSGSGYDESVPMTDPDRVPGARGAVWSSGPSTVATASGTFLTGSDWGAWDGALAVGVQKGQQVLLLRLSEDGATVTEQTTLPELGEFGRIRTVSAQPDGSLLVTTDNGETDSVLLVAPQT
ncbi:Glucose/arabinose dehydrogenase, beta-propeller fold [Rhodococcoides kroppenstedtii]|uniref:Glucose/arabinose dehydrogenase, beta-propeller fold n=1 Tax=Rhodococcoides kroppenstedtii TaxID=293050 RepID=A0A1I0T700_9NOCA|nr:PQQ-dependent sugar dehydrogenase [Rhodococcus kroppenstedtii]SFA47373.1 Glucose/arabinose dehydrogenase, beta-propeller fold [Rhodococcus kroppenstedtii]